MYKNIFHRSFHIKSERRKTMGNVYKLSNNTKDYLDTYLNILGKMEENMSEAEVTNSISTTFISQMIPHHEGAIEMSKNILRFTTNSDIEALANEIISEQTTGIDKMKEMSQNCSQTTNSDRDLKLYLSGFQKVFENMIKQMKNTRTSNNLDVNFLSEMIPHHMGAVNMCKNLLLFDICLPLRELAEKMVYDQMEQLKTMQKLLFSLENK